MDELIELIKENHSYTLPSANTNDLIENFEKAYEFKIDSDLRNFYLKCGEASLFDGKYQILPITEFQHISLAVYGEDSEEWCPASWFTLCYLGDNNYTGIVLSAEIQKESKIIDCWHEDLSECSIVALSFTEFLTKALKSSGNLYWLDENFKNYGTVSDNCTK